MNELNGQVRPMRVEGLYVPQAAQSDNVPQDGDPSGERRVVFGDELGVGTVLVLPCKGSVCNFRSPGCRLPREARSPHHVTIMRLRRQGTLLSGVVVDDAGVERGWTGAVDTPLEVLAATLAAAPDSSEVGAGEPHRADVYRVRVWSSRRWGVLGPWGWRAQVDHVSNWREHGDAPLFAGSGRWHRGQGEAVDWAVEEAHLIHDGEGCGDCHQLGLTPGELPLVIQVGGVVVEDHRTDAAAGGDRR